MRSIGPPEILIIFATALLFVVGLAIDRRRSKFLLGTGSAFGGTKVSTNETTRLLSASGLLAGAGFRKKVLGHLDDQNRAVAPEIGLDAALVAQICQFAEDREKRYAWFFLLIAILGAILAAVTDPTLAVVTAGLASALLYLKKSAQERGFGRRYFQRGNFDPTAVKERFPAHLGRLDSSALSAAAQNLVVYQGFTPFIGAGISLGGWSFTVDVCNASDDRFPKLPAEPVRFEVEELYAVIKEAIRSLGLDCLTIEDYCFVNGAEIRDDQKILPNIFGRPVQSLEETAADEFKKTSDPRIRHYQWIRAHDWGNELVMSFFLRCALRGNSLFVEINRFLLAPLSTECRAVDKLVRPRWKDHIAQLVKSVIAGPLYLIGSVFLVLAKLYEAVETLFDAKNRRRRQEIEANPLYNYGAQTSLRQMFTGDSFSHYFQKLDGDFYSKVLEHQILDAVVDFLDERNIDTSEIRERRTTILNNGVIVQGGDVKAESLAVGAGATAMKSEGSHSRKKTTAKGAAA